MTVDNSGIVVVGEVEERSEVVVLDAGESVGDSSFPEEDGG